MAAATARAPPVVSRADCLSLLSACDPRRLSLASIHFVEGPSLSLSSSSSSSMLVAVPLLSSLVLAAVSLLRDQRRLRWKGEDLALDSTQNPRRRRTFRDRLYGKRPRRK